MAHDANHGHGAHAVHHDVNGDKGAAFVGLIAGMVLLGGLIFGMVKWTNHHLGAGDAHGTATESTK